MISIDTLKKLLSPKEMKNVLGGSGDGDFCFKCYIGGFLYKGTNVDSSNCVAIAEALCDDDKSYVCAPITHADCN